MKKIKESPLFWPATFKGKTLLVLDETLIPEEMHYIKVTTLKGAIRVIKDMKTRAFGQLLVVLSAFILQINNSKNLSQKELFLRIQKAAKDLNNSRPTFPFSEVTGMVVGWSAMALKDRNDICKVVTEYIAGYFQAIRMRRLDRVSRIAKLIKNGDSILTHCNVSGELAMAAAICKDQGKELHIFATETMPYLQGAKLTTWELKRMGVKVTLVADNTIASLMADGLVNKIIVGSDRSCANGDFANKIGTYQIAVLAKEFAIPFYVLTQPSNKVKKGEDIPIEIRDEKELLYFEGKKIVPGNINGFYPGFDVIPSKYVTSTVPIDVSGKR